MEKKQQQQQDEKKGEPKKVKVLSTSSLQINEEDASRLVGSIIEKGISDSQGNNIITTPPSSFPKPTVLPFPVARHRSHGPHWHPLSSKGGDGGNDDDYSDNDVEDKEDKIFKEFEKVSAFANPVQKRKKKGLDLKKWKEVTQDNYCPLEKESDDVISQATGKKKNEKGSKNADKKISPADGVALASMEVDTKPQLNNFRGLLNSATPMEIDTSNKVDTQGRNKDATIYDSNVVNELMPERDHITNDKNPNHNFGSLDALRAAQNNLTTNMVSSSSSSTIRTEQESMPLEDEIDAENRARIMQMSPEEIAEAQAEIMEKINPTLLKVLQKRGREKVKKQDGLKSEVGNSNASMNQNVHSHQDAKRLHMEDKISHMSMSQPLENKLDDEKNRATTVTTASGSSWNAWSSRVEAVRKLRFSLAGDPVDTDWASMYDDISERDYLRTEGDPGAAGYTIKEAVALTRSVVPGQRSLALHLLSSVLDKALKYICKDRTVHLSKSENEVDWEAVWAFALGPEPELALSLRMCLDDNHNSVVLACGKVVQSVLSCDVNDNYFNISEIAICDKDICTAPVFRSRPDIDLGFLHGGFWKYSTKPTNILPFSEDSMDDESEGKHTIQDDVVVAGQDFTAGLVRMGILPRLRYLLETDPTAALEECIISILIAIVRHSPSCANAVLKCERLIQTIVKRFTVKNIEIRWSMIKSVNLMKVLALVNQKTCSEFIRNGYFQTMTWNLYQCPSSIDHWVNTGKEKCKLASALIVEQLRFWKVCIQYGYYVSYFSEMFPALCFWLNPPSFEKLVDKDILYEYASISREAYLVLGSLAARLPNLFSQQSLNNQISESAGDTELWSWSYVGPMVDLALKWIATRNDPQVSNLFKGQNEGRFDSTSLELCVTSLLLVYAAVAHMLFRVLERVTMGDTISPHKTERHVLWLPEFVPKIGLELIRYWLSGFSGSFGTECGRDPNSSESFMKELLYLRQKGDVEMSLASTCCLNGMVNVIATIDKLIQSARSVTSNLPSQDQSLSKEGKVLEDGILRSCWVELRSVLSVLTSSVDSGWRYVQAIEIFGRGGPAPGVGVGWGAPHGGYWSKSVLSIQIDARFLICLLQTLQNASKDVPVIEENILFIQKINTLLRLCLTAGPREKCVVNEALDVLFDVSALKYLDLCAQNFLLNTRGKTFGWKHEQEDYLHFSRILSSHFRSRWLSEKVKSKSVNGSGSSITNSSLKGNARLDTIFEDSDMSPGTSSSCTSLMIEWAHQKLPLPLHFYLSPISTIFRSKQSGPQNVDGSDRIQGPSNLLEVAKSGLFFVFGIEAMSSFQGHDIPSPIQHVSLTWKLHSMSVNFLVGMEILEKEQSRETFEALQDLYGVLLDNARLKRSEETISDDKIHLEFLKFQSEIHESYSLFIEELVEQFSAISYGDLIFSRQVSFYLHRCVESSIRLAAWNALSNAHVLELLPQLEKCISGSEGYLEPIEDNEGVLEAYTKSWTSDALDRAAIRGSIAYTLVVHHLSSFIFNTCPTDKLLLRNRLTRSLLRDYAGKQRHEGMLLNLIHYNKIAPTSYTGLDFRIKVLVEACDGNSTLLKVVEKLKAAAEKISL